MGRRTEGDGWRADGIYISEIKHFRCFDGAVVSARKMWEDVSQAEPNHQPDTSPLILRHPRHGSDLEAPRLLKRERFQFPAQN